MAIASSIELASLDDPVPHDRSAPARTLRASLVLEPGGPRCHIIQAKPKSPS